MWRPRVECSGWCVATPAPIVRAGATAMVATTYADAATVAEQLGVNTAAETRAATSTTHTAIGAAAATMFTEPDTTVLPAGYQRDTLALSVAPQRRCARPQHHHVDGAHRLRRPDPGGLGAATLTGSELRHLPGVVASARISMVPVAALVWTLEMAGVGPTLGTRDHRTAAPTCRLGSGKPDTVGTAPQRPPAGQAPCSARSITDHGTEAGRGQR